MEADRIQNIENETKDAVPDENNDLDKQNITPYNPTVSVPPSFDPVSIETLETEDTDIEDKVLHMQFLLLKSGVDVDSNNAK